MYMETIKEKLTNKGYTISPNYGLIIKDEYILADIRKSEGRIVLPHSNEFPNENLFKLKEELLESKISFRDRPSHESN